LTLAVEPVLLNETYSGNETTENQTATFMCVADGIPLPNIVWLHNGHFIFPTPRHMILEVPVASTYRQHVPTAIRSVLTVFQLRLRESGDYTCRVDPFDVDRGQSDFSSILDLYVEPGTKLSLSLITMIAVIAQSMLSVFLLSVQHLLTIARTNRVGMAASVPIRLKVTYVCVIPCIGEG
jgi:hypothetical protein